MTDLEKVMVELSKAAAELNISIQQATNAICEISSLAKELEEEINNRKAVE